MTPPRVCLRTVTRRALAALGVAALLAAPAGAAPAERRGQVAIHGGLGVQLRNVPVAQGGDPLARLYIIERVRPGAVIHRLIEVSNTTTSPMPIVLYPSAATIAGGSFVGAAGHTANSLSTWTAVRPGTSDLPAGAHLTASVTISVPRHASPGEQYAVVWAETRSAPRTGYGITEISRVGVRVYLSVGAGGDRPPRFTIQSVAARRTPDGHPMVVATVRNNGGLALDIYGALQLTAGPGNTRAGPFAAKLGSTLPVGGTEPVTIILGKQLPDGPWNATVTLHSGLLSDAAQTPITFPHRASSPPSAALLAVAISLLLIATLIVAVTRACKRRPPSRPIGSRE